MMHEQSNFDILLLADAKTPVLGLKIPSRIETGVEHQDNVGSSQV